MSTSHPANAITYEIYENGRIPPSVVIVLRHILLAHSWGPSYIKHVNPIAELKNSVFLVVAYCERTIVGLGAVNPKADPRPGGSENDQDRLWFCDWCTVPGYEGQGIGRHVYDVCIAFMRNTGKLMRLSGENEKMLQKLAKAGWIVIDDSTINAHGPCINEQGDETTIMALAASR